jgi:hypothetical protein
MLEQQERSTWNPVDVSILFPSQQSYRAGYQQVATLLSRKEFAKSEIGLVLVCGVVAAFASYYNFSFSKAYVHDVSTRWGFSESDAALFSRFCGVMGFIINIGINGRSIHQFYSVIKDEIIQQTTNKALMPDDNIIRTSVGVMALLSAIGALPNLKFVYDTTKDEHIAYLVFMEIIQFITQSALNLRGIYNTFKINSEKKKVAKMFKLDMLVATNQCLTSSKLSEEDIKALSEGNLAQRKYPILQSCLKGLARLYVLPYSLAFYFAVKDLVPKDNTNNYLDMLTTLGGMLSGGLKCFLLGNAYESLIDRVFNLFLQEPILKLDQNEIRAQYTSRNMERILAIMGLLLAIFSLGSSSKIVEKYFFEDQDKTAQTFWISFILGGGAAWGINATDLSILIERFIDFGMYLSKVVTPSEDPLDYLGCSHNEMMMRIMLVLSRMPESTFLQKFTEEFNVMPPSFCTLDRLELAEQALPSKKDHHDLNQDRAKQEATPSNVYIPHGYRASRLYTFFQHSFSNLSSVASDLAFKAFKTFGPYADQEDNRELEPLVKHK